MSQIQNNKAGKHLLRGSLPMRPHLLSFLVVKENLQAGQALLLPGGTVVGQYLDALLLNKGAVEDDRRQYIPDTYTGELGFEFSEGRGDRPNIFLSSTRIIRFNEFTHNYMHETLFESVLFNQRNGGMSEKEVIYKFIEYYRIYTINFDSLKKASYRYRLAKNLDIFCSGKRPTVSGGVIRYKSTFCANRKCPTISGYNVPMETQ